MEQAPVCSVDLYWLIDNLFVVGWLVSWVGLAGKAGPAKQPDNQTTW